jgi:CRISPR-associated protein Cas4
MEKKTIVPARMVNEYVYCPRLCHIEWVQGDFKESVDTVEGRYSHRRVDVQKGVVPENANVEEKIHSTSVDIGSEGLGAVAKIDLLEGEGGTVRPVDYKKGRSPNIPEKAYLPERVQLCVQGLLLRDNGYTCDEGVIYFVGSKQRVTIPFDDQLIATTKDAIKASRDLWDLEEPPPPLIGSSKCYRCSLASLCLPDETNRLAQGDGEVRRLFPARDDLIPVYVIGEGHVVKKHEGRLEVWKEGEKIAEVPLHDLSQLSLFGNSSITIPAMAELMDRGIPISFFSHGG